MHSVTVLHNQSLLDISLQVYGNLSGMFLLAKLNNLAITDNLNPGDVLMLPELETSDVNIVTYYSNKSIKPANAINQATLSPGPSGIDYWAIGVNFIVQ